MLKEDHRKVEKAFKDFEKLQKAETKDTSACEQMVEQTCLALEVHAQLEEDHFYPAVREAIEQTDLIDEAEVEHQTLKALIAQIRALPSSGDKFAATFTVLGEYVLHHIKEEEGEIFKKITRAKIDWAHLLEAMQEEKVRLIREKGLSEDAAGTDGHSQGRKRSSH